MIAVIFEGWPAEGEGQRYLDIAASLRPILDGVPGFLSIERFQSLADPGKLLSLSFWEDEAAVSAWRNTQAHRAAQAKGRSGVFRDYRLRIAAVIRDYGIENRSEAPADSIAAHGCGPARAGTGPCSARSPRRKS
ncbi:MAG: antibiotic biosynthesis monooxygenase [Proteobacteria bacterium]|nr:antibiotic biosynthesis monooxygenase [Pseudomonadota bacterium]